MTFNGRVEAQFMVPSGSTLTATNGGSPKSIPIPASSYYLTDLIAVALSNLNTLSDSAAWTVALSTGANGTGQVTFNAPGTFSLQFTTAAFAALFGFAGDIIAASSPQTGPSQARSLWIPDSPLAVDGDPTVAPPASDLRQTQSPTGTVLGLVGNRRYVHNNLRWTGIPANRVWAAKELVANQSWQTFATDSMLGFGTGDLGAWFRVNALMKIYDINGVALGTNTPLGWQFAGGFDPLVAPKMTKAPYTGLWTIVVPQTVSSLS